MMATWSESEESSEEENEKEVANMCFMAIDDLDEDKWFLDSGCSRHMTGDESKFAFLTKRKEGYVTFGDNSKGRIIGQGNIGNDTSSLIESVLLVDGLKHNLLSISQLCDKGFKVLFEASHCIIKDIQNDKIIFMGHRCDNVYAINISKYDGHDKRFSSMHDQSWLCIGGHQALEENLMLLLLWMTSLDTLRSDHGREFENIDFEDYCNEHGINHNFSAPRTPQQNGVVERKNRILQEMAITMLNENNLPKYFWAEAVNTSCYVLNRIFDNPTLGSLACHLLDLQYNGS
ncbi:Retrovirus-related Pol polyprotein from transposon TNT 1-94 [Vitis vinifera]|uniref:Retrovirus-related Pol polyprotein from transposon TNT 1-94 n=1 Tax=Vitis vinifera TaxID=29760 RepID=A0A438HCR2_VITVI|nr:Retrovirus-related Pol polyprotein from transposon TNT 1-94 [Vitis vinifera]